jgi:hypothetical protein
MIIIFVEDPGAINYFTLLIRFFKSIHLEFRVFGDGLALEDHNLISYGIAPLANSDIKIFDLSTIDSVFVGTSENINSISFRLLSWASRNHVISFALVDSSANSHQRFSGQTNNPTQYAPNYLFVPDTFAKDLFVSHGFLEHHIFVIGTPNPNFKIETKNHIEPTNFTKHAGLRKIITFVSEISDGLNPSQYKHSKDYSIHGTSGSISRTSIVIEEMLYCINALRESMGWNPYLVLRLHPKENAKSHDQYLRAFDYISVDDPPVHVINASDLVIGMSSMLLYEAFLINKPCFSILPRTQEKDWLPIIRNNNIHCALTRQAILKLLNDFANGKSIASNREETLFFDPLNVYSIMVKICHGDQITK